MGSKHVAAINNNRIVQQVGVKCHVNTFFVYHWDEFGRGKRGLILLLFDQQETVGHTKQICKIRPLPYEAEVLPNTWRISKAY